MKGLYELIILLGMFAVMFGARWLLDRHFKKPDDLDVYTLSDTQGREIKIYVGKQATTAEREKIFSEKFRELIQQQAP